MPKKYSVSSLIICDDIKPEGDTGKDILLGVYDRLIILHKPPPINLSALWFRIALDLKSNISGKATFEILDAKRKKFFSLPPRDISFKKPPSTAIISIQISPFHISKIGIFSVRFGFGKEVRKIGEFEITYKK